MNANDGVVFDCARKLDSARRLAQATADAGKTLTELTRMLDATTAADPGFQAGEAEEDAADSLTAARRSLRHLLRIVEARETDLTDQLEELEEIRGAAKAADYGA